MHSRISPSPAFLPQACSSLSRRLVGIKHTNAHGYASPLILCLNAYKLLAWLTTRPLFCPSPDPILSYTPSHLFPVGPHSITRLQLVLELTLVDNPATLKHLRAGRNPRHLSPAETPVSPKRAQLCFSPPRIPKSWAGHTTTPSLYNNVQVQSPD